DPDFELCTLPFAFCLLTCFHPIGQQVKMQSAKGKWQNHTPVPSPQPPAPSANAPSLGSASAPFKLDCFFMKPSGPIISAGWWLRKWCRTSCTRYARPEDVS